MRATLPEAGSAAAGADRRRRTRMSNPAGAVVRLSGDADGELALCVGGAEGLQRLAGALKVVGVLDRDLECPGVQQLRRRSRLSAPHAVTLTPAGERHLDSAAQAQREAEDALFAGLDSEQREQLRVLLIAVRDSLATKTDDACGYQGRGG
ncbi:MAG: hypothetical protein QOH46_3872 [Solirubrobacteraceae bacterium]|nr:hypothetical protein [Solirubrobacteraceae bacterium]